MIERRNELTCCIILNIHAHIHIDTHPHASTHTHKYSSGPDGQGGGYRATSFACVSTEIYLHIDFVCASVRVEERTLGLTLALAIVRARCLRRRTFTPSLGNCDKTAVHYVHSSPPACARAASSIYTHKRASSIFTHKRASSIFTHIHVNIFPPKKPTNFPSTSRSASHPCLVSIKPSPRPQTLRSPPPAPPHSARYEAQSVAQSSSSISEPAKLTQLPCDSRDPGLCPAPSFSDSLWLDARDSQRGSCQKF